jgi:RNA-binding protein
VVQIGKNGLTDQLFVAVDIALNAHELIKIKFLIFQEQKKELSQEIAERLNCER